jgi:hypothetical protein
VATMTPPAWVWLVLAVVLWPRPVCRRGRGGDSRPGAWLGSAVWRLGTRHQQERSSAQRGTSRAGWPFGRLTAPWTRVEVSSIVSRVAGTFVAARRRTRSEPEHGVGAAGRFTRARAGIRGGWLSRSRARRRRYRAKRPLTGVGWRWTSVLPAGISAARARWTTGISASRSYGTGCWRR